MKIFSRLVAVAVSVVVFALPTLRAQDPALDASFVSTLSPGLTPSSYVPPPATPDFTSGTGAVNAVALLSDGKILAGGNVSRYQTSGSLSALKRLLPTGALDTTFNPSGAGLATSSGQPEVNTLLTDSANRTYVGGTFDSYNGTARSGILRLLPDGTLDPAFAPTGLGGNTRYARTLALQSDGKLLVGGAFSSINSTARNHLARLSSDGTLDTTFSAAFAFSATSTAAVGDIALLPDGRILVAATTSTSRPSLFRLLADGTLDPSFSAALATTTGFGAVNHLALLPDGRIAAAGFFTLSDTGAEVDFAVFRADGSLDTTFHTALGTGPNGSVLDLLLSPDGRLLASGIFTEWNGQPRASVALVNLDGTLDPTFSPAPYTTNRHDNGQPFYSSHLYSLAVQPDGKLLAGGWFARISDPTLETYNLTRFNFGHAPASPGTLRLLAPTASVAENAGSLTLQVSRFGGTTGAVTAQIAMLAGGPGGATPGSDFTTINPTLSWASGEGGIKSVTIPILQDTAIEAPETFDVTILTTTGGATVPAGFGFTRVTIRDDDSVPSFTLQPASVSLEQGASFTLSARYDSVLTATVKWQRDPDGTGPLGFSDLLGADAATYTVSVSDPLIHSGTYRAVATNANGSANSTPATVSIAVPAGSVVTTFTPPALTETVFGAAIDTEGKFIIASQLGLRRYTAGGSADGTFTNSTFATLPVTSLHLLPDGKILVGGYFTSVTNGSGSAASRPTLARFSSAGVLDPAFTPALPTAASGTLSAQTIAPGSGNKYYVGFGSGGGLRRYLADGTLDNTFTAPASLGQGINGVIYSVRERPDGRLLVAHQNNPNFSTVTYHLSLLETNGTAASTALFTPPTFNNTVRVIELLPDGRIALGGQFANVNGVIHARLALLQADGTLDRSFRAPTGLGPDGLPQRILYRNGRLLVAGEFSNIGGLAIRGLARVNLDGSLDSSFSIGSGADNSVYTAAYTPSGDILVGGSFTTFKGVARQRVALLVGNAQIDAVGFAPASLTVVESGSTATLTARRYGSGTEAVSIAYATAGAHPLLGDTTAVAGTDYTGATGTLSWAAGDTADKTLTVQLFNDATVEATKTFRVLLSNPSGPVSAAAPATVHILDDDTPATFTTQPAATSTFGAGASLSLSAAVSSPTAVSYQWFLNGVALPGATSATYTKAALTAADAGLYTAVATNTAGSVTSTPAHVIVTPVSGKLAPGQAATGRPSFTAAPAALVPLNDGGALVGGSFNINVSTNVPQDYLIRIRADGSTDTSFTLAPSGNITALRRQSDGKILVLGTYFTFGGTGTRYLARLNADLTLDTAFNTAVGTTISSSLGNPTDLALDSTGRIYVSFNNFTLGGAILRLSAGGVIDPSYSVASTGGGVTALGILPDDRLVAAGTFTTLAGVTRARVGRLSTTGTLDTTFTPAVASNFPYNDLVVTPAGRIFAVGGTGSGSNLFEINPDGSATVFGLTTGNQLYAAAVGPDGRLALARASSGGSGSVSRLNLPATTGIGSATNDTTFNVGTGPNADARTLAYASDGTLWVAGQFTTFDGFASGGVVRLQGSAGDPGIVNPPARLDANPGSTARLSVGATGTNLSYQWFKNGSPLSNDTRISGATTAILAISGLTVTDDDTYTVQVTGGTPQTTLTSAPAKLNVLGAPFAATSPASATPALGSTVTLAADILAAAPATYVWRRDGVLLIDGGRYSGTSTGKLVITGANASDNGAYTLTVTNPLGTTSTTPATLSVAQVATDRDPATTAVSAASRTNTFLHLPDGRTLVGSQGNLTGAASTTSNTRLSVIETDGRVTPSALGVFNNEVSRLIRQPDGKILVLGSFTAIGANSGSGHSRFVRLHADLTRDTTFAPYQPPLAPTTAVVDAEGRIYLLCGVLSYEGRSGYNYFVRLHPNGAHDLSFNLNLDSSPLALALQPDGKILLAGEFRNHGSPATPAKGLLRLHADGTVDTSFTSAVIPANATTHNVASLAVDSQGRILAGYTYYNGTFNYGVARLLPTGALDPAFTFTETMNQAPSHLVPLPDGQILVGGSFSTPVNSLFRLHSDGSRDTAFSTALGTGFGASPVFLRALVPDALGRLWIGGDFSTFKGATTTGLVVLQGSPSPALAVTTPPAGQVRELGATATFTASASGNNGFTYQWLRNGQPLANSSRISGVTTPTLTLTGLLATDADAYSVRVTSPSTTATSAAAQLVVLAAPEITADPADLTTDLGATASFTASARGAGTLSYRWLYGTTELTDGPVTGGTTYSGTSTPTLTITGLTFGQAGQYRLRVSNTHGTADTAFATLTVQRVPGALAPGIGAPAASGVRAILRLADGSMLIGGTFNSVTVNGVSQTRGRIARFLPDGTLDPAFNVSFGDAVNALAQDSSGRIFVGGNFTSVTVGTTTTPRLRVARLTSAFALDTAFDTSTAGPNAQINAVTPTENGGVYVGGAFGFNLVGTASVNRVARLSATGALDTAFNVPTTVVNNEVKALLRRSDGKLYIGGTFGTTLVTTAGARDTAFTPDAPHILAVQGQSLLLLADGSLLLGANGGLPQPYLRRLNANTGATLTDYGTLHGSQVSALAQQTDGKLLSGSIGGFVRTNLAGTADTGFGAFNSTVSAIAVDGVGRIWVGGSFTTYNGFAQSGLAVLTGGDFDSRDGLLLPHTLTFTDIPDRTFGDTGNSVPLSASSDRGLSPIAFAVTSGPATLNGSTLTITGAGEVTVTASQAGNATIRSATATQSFTVAKAAQSINFAALTGKSTGSAPFAVTATATSGLPVTFTVSGPATLSGNTVTLNGTEGTVTVTATQPGDANYAAATAVPRSFEVTAIPLTTQTISFTQPLPNRLSSAGSLKLTATASSGLAVVYTVSGPATLGSDGSTLTLTGELGTVTVTATQPGGERNGSAFSAAPAIPRSFDVIAAPPSTTQTITFTQPPGLTYGGDALELSATASSELPVTFELVSGPGLLDGDTLTPTGAGKITVRATQPGDGTFKPATAVTRTVTVAKAVLLVHCFDYTRLVGVANPANYGFTYSGFIGDDDESDITTPPSGVTTATVKSPAGTYPLTLKGGLATNYTFAPGDLGSVIVESFAGALEAFLIDSSDVPRGKLELAFSANSLAYTGVLTLDSEPAPITVRGLLAAADSTLATSAWIRAGAGGALLTLDFTLSGSTLSGILKNNGVTLLTVASSNRLFVQATEGKTKLPAPWTGAHTLILRDPQPLTETDARQLPLGSGSASATIGSTGLLTVKGTLADGTPLTTTAKPDTDGTYRLFAKPYAKRLGSLLSGPLTLVEHPDQSRFPNRYYVPDTDGLLFWIKAASPAKPLDKSSRQGFAATVVALLDPWLAPTPATTLGQRLGLTESPTASTALDLTFGLGESHDFGADSAKVPARLALSPAGAFTVAAPVTTPANSTKFTVKVTPATGVFTGSFNLVDIVPPATKASTRKITFTGILRQPPSSESAPVLGYGQFLLPAPGQPAAEQTALELQLSAPALE